MNQVPPPQRSSFRTVVKTVLLLAGLVTLVFGAMSAREAQLRRRAGNNLDQIKTAIDAYHARQPKP